MSIFTPKHMRDLTRRVYLLECETGTQEGLDIRPKKVVDITPAHQAHLDAIEAYRLRRDNYYLTLKNKRQERTIHERYKHQHETIRKLQAEVKHQGELRMQQADHLVEQSKQISTLEQANTSLGRVNGNLRIKLNHQADRIEELGREIRAIHNSAHPAPHYAACPAKHYSYVGPSIRKCYHQCPCGRGWVLG